MRNVLPGDAEMILKQVQDGMTAMHSLRPRRNPFVDSEMKNVIIAPAEQPVCCVMICNVIRSSRWGKEPKPMYAFSAKRLPRWGREKTALQFHKSKAPSGETLVANENHSMF